MEQNLKSFCEKLLEIKEPNVVVTLTNVRGEAPQDVGARMIVTKDGIAFGTIGGGKIEAHCLKLASEFLISEEKVQAQSHTWNLQKDIGMTCGGEVTVFFETNTNTETFDIAIFGAGHISQELTRILLHLDCNLTVIDNRKEWIDKLPTHSKLKTIHSENMADEVSKLSKDSYVALMTMGHASDVPILKEALTNSNFPYLGVIGSEQKRNRMEGELIERGVSKEKLKDFYCPMGLDIGNNSPGEISISIISQILGIRSN